MCRIFVFVDRFERERKRGEDGRCSFFWLRIILEKGEINRERERERGKYEICTTFCAQKRIKFRNSGRMKSLSSTQGGDDDDGNSKNESCLSLSQFFLLTFYSLLFSTNVFKLEI